MTQDQAEVRAAKKNKRAYPRHVYVAEMVQNTIWEVTKYVGGRRVTGEV